MRPRVAAQRGLRDERPPARGGTSRPEAPRSRAGRVLEALPLATRLGLRHGSPGRSRRPAGGLPAGQGARRLVLDQRDDGDPRPSRRPGPVAARLELGRRRGVVRAERPSFPPGDPARPQPADARLPRVGGRRRRPARSGPQRRRQHGRRAHAGLHPPRTSPQCRRRLPETGHAQAEPDGRHRRARDPPPRREGSCPRGRVPHGWARGGGARCARGRARRRGDRHAQAPPPLGDRPRRGARAARDRRGRRIARRGREPARPPGERCARHGRRRDAPDGRAAASPALVAGAGTGPAHVERGGGRSVRPASTLPPPGRSSS